ncbi:uncharacterized protein AKAW2_21547S [Aspergillus luchuensis]|uniref:Uncharacterized protein n=1 Tax=Aspergillus kawachii TaxID=1069201 RepID=A0A7R7W585_ASPKA|nr:uncharacterized protein AKAW2_21547S [Aspergillus luchuensis]BCR96607.1 hypothetical protein AKAW2_21547S [Aspergillus luchuensis]BCS09113.1 hypothetical protein ALUC_21483S [Aspergillus luchuensis]
MERTQAQPSSSNLKSSPEQSSPPAPAVCLTNADEAPNPVASLSEEDNVSETEHSAVLSRKEEHAHGVQEMERLVDAGGQRWEDWTVLQGLLPPRRSLADHFAEALIHKAIMENVFSNSFQYLDGKTSSTDQAEDKRFASKLQYLYERFFDTYPNVATLWKEQTHRLANSTDPVKAPGDLSFGRDNAKRLLACAPCLADEMLASEPIGLLLKKRLGRNQVAKRRKELIEIFEASLGLMKDCETRVGGHFKIKRLSELGPLYQCGSSYMIFHLSNGDIVDEMDFEGRKILLVARPTIMYTDIAPSGPNPSCKSVAAIISKASVVLDKGDEAKKSTTAKRRIIMRATCFEDGDVYVNTSEMF